MSKVSTRPVIRLRGVRHNNLKNFDLDLPLNRLIVITGLSGSGKSSLAFDTLFAEGQRRYIETFSPYARQFFDRMDKPQVDSIEGIPPAIAIEQRNTVRTTRSTVGTMTEICDHLKALWPHVARLHCRQCGRLVRREPAQEVWNELSAECGVRSEEWEGRRAEGGGRNAEWGVRSAEWEGRGADRRSLAGSEVVITFEVPMSEKLSAEESLGLVGKQGYRRLCLENEIVALEDPRVLSALRAPHAALTIVQDRLKLVSANRARFVEACEQAYHFGKGRLSVHEVSAGESGRPTLRGAPRRFSNRLHCASCDIEYRDPVPAFFSFNHPLGACPACRGFGRVISIDYDRALPDRSLTLAQGVVRPWRSGFSAECQRDLMKFCRARDIPVDVPFSRLSERHQRWVIEGDDGYGKDEEHEWPRAWYGVKGYYRWLESKAYKMHVRVLLSRYRAYTPCPDCHGTRFQPDTLLYRLPVDDGQSRRPAADTGAGRGSGASIANRKSKMSLADFYALPVRDALAVVETVAASGVTPEPLRVVLSEVRSRLGYLNAVGLGYLTLDRPTRSLSGGETERVNLTTCLGTRLVNTLFVLDEPSVGLHPRDTERLVRILEQLRDAGNSVVVVEHEAGVIRAADQIVDLGPGHGATGGEVVFQGTFSEILRSEASLTGCYLRGRNRVETSMRRPVRLGTGARPTRRSAGAASRPGSEAQPVLRLAHATRHNLKDVTVEFPLGRFVCVTGVSGSGKTTLIREVLLPALEEKLKSQISNFKSPISNLKSQSRATARRVEEPFPERSEEPDLAVPSSDLRPPTSVLTGWESLSRAILVDQSSLGKTPRSNPAVYIGAFDEIREVFAQSGAAQQRGLQASAFSFNSSQGQCERCRGAGFEKIEMQFLSDVYIRCPDCGGRRYRKHILEVKIAMSRAANKAGGSAGRGRPSTPGPRRSTVSWSIGDVLEATVDEVVDFLGALGDSRPARRACAGLKLLQEVGLGYLRLGQPINTLSGGESQRLKLVRHLAEAMNGNKESNRQSGGDAARPSALDPRPILFLFDEPTTGLHFDDVRVLLKVFQRLVDFGHSVLVIEHNLDVIRSADWIIDLGPGAGDEGGRVVAQGTAETVAGCVESHTGRFLREGPVAGSPEAATSVRAKRPGGNEPALAAACGSRAGGG